MVNISHKFFMEAILIFKDSNIELEPESLHSAVIDRQYDNSNRPIIYLTLNVKSDIYDKMVLEKETALINLRITKSIKNTDGNLGETYIHDVFRYLIKTDPDYSASLRNIEKSPSGEDAYMYGTVALFRKDCLDRIKHLHNDIISGANQASIIHRYTSHMKMVMQPLTFNRNMGTIIIPPMESVTELLAFLNSVSVLYDRRYRYFEDFDVAYLLNQDGKPVPTKSDEFNSVIVKVVDILNTNESVDGVIVDKDARAYILQVSTITTSMDVNGNDDIEYTYLIGVSSSGQIRKMKLKDGDDNPDKVMIARIPNNNMRYLDNILYDKCSSYNILQVTKEDVDGSLFTPNKEYLIDNYKDYKEYNGRYILSYKKEVIIRQGQDYSSEVVLGLRKVEERPR